ncbi:two-partner secretion domain-containing protein [Anabaena sp. WFMT]|uniref:two-partner secretion domain-containing protein n=1 Tax=Anabaena sp. WFMT TaxID=3449730 RepID=UPI003F2496AC
MKNLRRYSIWSLKRILSTFTTGLFFSSMVSPVIAEVISDGTTNTIVNLNGNNFNILNGIKKGNDLFHSFTNFSVPIGGSASFDLVNTPDIKTIFSRVTGGNVSNIDGLIQTLNGNHPASLFLMNPHGIIFGKNARLDIGGSFVGTTANSIKFSDGVEFSADNAFIMPLLTMSVPVGLQMGSNPGAITISGTGHKFTSFGAAINGTASMEKLSVEQGKTLALVGGDITLDGAVLTAEQGRIELGSLNGREFVNLQLLEQGFALDYTQVSNLGNIHLSKKSLLDTSGSPSGHIQLQAKKISIAEGSLVLTQNQGSQGGGILNVNTTELLEISGYLPTVGIRTSLLSEALGTGTSGDIRVSTKRLVIKDGAGIDNNTYGQGNSGSININASESIQVKDYDPANAFSTISSTTLSTGVGGNVTVSTPDLLVVNGAVVGSITTGNGAGGNLVINADHIQVSGNNTPGVTALSTASLVAGNAGNLTINTNKLIVDNSGAVTSSSVGQGNAGDIKINALESIEITGNLPKAEHPSQIRSIVKSPSAFAQSFFNISATPQGDGGNIYINTPSLKINNQASVTVTNHGIGDSGTININVGSVLLDRNAGITASTNSGEGGNISLKLENLLLMRNNSLIDTEAKGLGNGGNITINSPIIVGLENSDIVANAVQGNGGNINITTQGIFGLKYRNEITPENDITASSQFGVNGTVDINNFGVDPSSGLVELPANVTDSSQQIATGCSTNQGSSFVATGRGGIPHNPNQQVRSDIYDGLRLRTWSDIRDISTYRSNRAVTAQLPKSSETFIQATSWHRNTQGKIQLIADSPAQVQQSLTCAAVPKS